MSISVLETFTVLAIDDFVGKAQESHLPIFEVDVKLLGFRTEVFRELLQECRPSRPAIARSVFVEQRMHDFRRFVSQLVGLRNTCWDMSSEFEKRF